MHKIVKNFVKFTMHKIGNNFVKFIKIPTIEENIKRINEIRENKLNTDSHISFSSEHINFVEDIVKKLKYQPYIFPTMNDSIQLEYEIDKDYLEFEIFSNFMIKVFQYHFNNEENSTIRSEYIKENDIYKIVEEYFTHKENSRKK